MLLGAALFGAFLIAAPAWADMKLPLASAPAEQVGMSKQRLDRIQEVFKKEADEGRLPGAVIMVARKGKIVYASAFGFQDKDAGKPMSMDSLFRIYSMTKPLVSVAAMILVEEGKLQLTDPVSKFIPAFKDQRVSVAKADAEFARVTYGTAPADREMTVQDLLRHTAGLAYGEITENAPVKDAYTKAGLYKPAVSRLRCARAHAGRIQRAVRRSAARAPARHLLGVQPRERPARPRGRSGVGQAPRRFPGRAHLQAAGHERHRLLACRRTKAAAWPKPSRPIRHRACRTS